MIKLLVIDDSPLMRRLLDGVFSAAGGFELAFARNGVEALDLLQTFRPTVVTLDVTMPQMDGLACLDRIMLERPCSVVMLSALTEAGAEAAIEAFRLGAVACIAKPQGAISLAIDALAPLLVETVRAAATARPRLSARLAERVRLRRGGATPETPQGAAQPALLPSNRLTAAPPDGIVLVGASTGGPPALDALLGPLPADFPWPILVAQHMPATFTGALARRLDSICALAVVEVTRPLPLRPGQVYVGRGDADIVVVKRSGIGAAGHGGLGVAAAPAAPELRWHPSVDRLVTSARQHVEAGRLIGVLMTGMGHDGAAAMTRLRQDGGRTIAEAESSAVVWGMPGELVRAGGADVVLPLDAIAPQLLAWTP